MLDCATTDNEQAWRRASYGARCPFAPLKPIVSSCLRLFWFSGRALSELSLLRREHEPRHAFSVYPHCLIEYFIVSYALLVPSYLVTLLSLWAVAGGRRSHATLSRASLSNCFGRCFSPPQTTATERSRLPPTFCGYGSVVIEDMRLPAHDHGGARSGSGEASPSYAVGDGDAGRVVAPTEVISRVISAPASQFQIV